MQTRLKSGCRSQEAVHQCRSVLSDLESLENALLQNKRKKTGQAQEAKGDGVWEGMDGNYKEIKQFCDGSLDRFHRQAMLQSGAATAKGSLSLLHQGISAQVLPSSIPTNHLFTRWHPSCKHRRRSF